MQEDPDPDSEAADEDAPRVPIGDSAAGEGDSPAPTGLPPERRRRQTVDDDPESQETG
jgi:hypothetical protein